MIEKQTIVDQIEINRNGTVQVRIGLLLTEDGNQIDCKWHRTSFTPGSDIDSQLAAVNAHLIALGNQPLTEGIDRIKAQASAAWTDGVVAAYAAQSA